MAGYLGASPVPQTIQKKETFTATAGQTTFNTTGYTDGNFINVFLNGVRLVNGTDYTATNGSDVVLATAASASDVLDFETFNEFQLSDQEFADSVIIENNTTEDSDGGRASKLVYKGKQSGGEQSTLAEIQASHDGTADDQKADLIFKTNDGSDNAAPTEAARIDSGQNLLVGTTSTTVYTSGSGGDAGVNLRADGQISNSCNSASVFNRMASDGPINLFYKNGSEVGRIGVAASNRFYIGNGDAGIRFLGDSDLVTPWKPDTNANSDNLLDLGNSANRWKDLYLGGGVFLGGTDAANHLDDYEEGTFTPKFQTTASATDIGSSYSGQSGRYVKIGNIVYFAFDMTAGSIGSTGGSICAFGGLPFSSSSSSLAYPVSSRNTTSITVASGHRFQPFVVAGGNFVFVQSESLTTQASSNISSFNASGRANIHGWYTVF